ncbi:hypothetical protein HCN44_009030 [Aphidius gifuensis]|uniref:Proline-rich protein PRCC n=1 Tax=Aphidius gifuensis TaxID=684658 RepID=A0A834XNQ9_APHGI|nr:proline-rich protein PRCC-like [Aphidius gifuensis]KAF7990087.1 hypothetical protein HCN44_009030 [Aphidius gifuensis]
MSLVAYDSSADDVSDEEQDVSIPASSSTLLLNKNTSLLEKKNRDPVKITVPSLSDFKDVDDEIELKKNKIQPSQRGTGLFALLPPPKGAQTLANFIPHVLKKQQTTTTTAASTNKKIISSSVSCTKKVTDSLTKYNTKYDTNSDDDDDNDDDNHQNQQSFSSTSNQKIDFFSLNKSIALPITPEIEAQNLYKPPPSPPSSSSSVVVDDDEVINEAKNKSTLTSNVVNLSRDEIIMKNKTDIGPKLPIPEQEYHVDEQGNVAFDEKAIEYLCGKRGVKRKAQLINSTNIIDINGEDIKPDEREWMVKALTENPIQRPIKIGSGPGGQSKKKHQITYLAHQAKAMEVELQNQWASNRIAKNQAKSKYGF